MMKITTLALAAVVALSAAPAMARGGGGGGFHGGGGSTGEGSTGADSTGRIPTGVRLSWRVSRPLLLRSRRCIWLRRAGLGLALLSWLLSTSGLLSTAGVLPATSLLHPPPALLAARLSTAGPPTPGLRAGLCFCSPALCAAAAPLSRSLTPRTKWRKVEFIPTDESVDSSGKALSNAFVTRHRSPKRPGARELAVRKTGSRVRWRSMAGCHNESRRELHGIPGHNCSPRSWAGTGRGGASAGDPATTIT